MARTSLSEDSLVRLEHYLSSNPYREYSMNKPYFPRTSHISTHSSRQTPQQQSSMLAFHQLLDNSRNSLSLDRLAYKLRMKSDLNIDTLREANGGRRRHYQRNQLASSTQNQLNLEVSDVTSSFLPSTTTVTTMASKPVTRQAPVMTLSTEAMKTLVNDDLAGIEGNAVRVGAVDDVLKRFRPFEYQIVRRPTEYSESPSTYTSNNVLPSDRAAMSKPYPQHQERLIRQPQALTEYRFKTPTFPSLSTRIQRESTNPPGLTSHVRTRDQYISTDNPDVSSLLHQCPLNSPEAHRQRFHFPTHQPQHLAETNPYDKRIQDSREKSLMRTEKQSYVCNTLTIGDPFSSNADRMATAIYRFQQAQEQQPPITTNYIFPPVRPFGYFTKKPTNDDSLPAPPGNSSFSPRLRKKHGINKKAHQVSRNISDAADRHQTTQTFRGRIKSADTLSDDDDTDVHNTTIAVDYNVAGTLLETAVEDGEP